MKTFLRSWCLLFLSLYLGLNLGQAQSITDQQLTIVPTRAVEPLQVLVKSSGEDGLLSGEILSRRPLYASVLQFTLLDQNKGIAWQDDLKLPDDARRICLLYTSPSPRDQRGSRMPSSA